MSAGRLAACLLVVATFGCTGGGDGADDVPAPRVDLIDDAIAAVEQHYGGAQDYFEISADLERVSVIVAVDGATAAEQGYYLADGTFEAPVPVGEASGATFTADRIDLDPGRIFDRVRDELDDPVIVDFAVQGGGDRVVYDATIASDGGGVLLVLLGPTGEILGAQAQ